MILQGVKNGEVISKGFKVEHSVYILIFKLYSKRKHLPIKDKSSLYVRITADDS